MSAPLHFRRQGFVLVPADDETSEWIAKRKQGEAVAMSAEQVRNAERSALYWVLCSLVAKNHATLKTREQVSDTLKLLCGLVETWSVTLETGERCFWAKPRSISFASMSEGEFEKYFEASLDMIAEQLLPGVDVEELRKEAYLAAGSISSSAVR
jgi:hypothetical protein